MGRNAWKGEEARGTLCSADQSVSSVSCGRIAAGGYLRGYGPLSPGPQTWGARLGRNHPGCCQLSEHGVPSVAARGRASLGYQQDRALRGKLGPSIHVALRWSPEKGRPGKRCLRACPLHLTKEPLAQELRSSPPLSHWATFPSSRRPHCPHISLQSLTVPGGGIGLGGDRKCESGAIKSECSLLHENLGRASVCFGLRAVF